MTKSQSASFFRLLLICTALLFRHVCLAQDYSIDLSNIDQVQIKSQVAIDLQTHASETLLLPASKNERALQHPSSLKSVYSDIDSLGYGIKVERKGSTLYVESVKERRGSDHFIYLPKHLNVTVDMSGNKGVNIEGLEGEIEVVTRNGDLTMKAVTGPIVASSTNGKILVEFSEISSVSPTSLITSNGDIEIILGRVSGVDLHLKSPHGTTFTDFDLNKSDIQKGRENREIKTQLGGGGVSVKVITYTGNIYLRQKSSSQSGEGFK